MKTKVKSSFSQVPMSSSVHGSSGPSRRTRSKQKRLGDPVEREREREKGKASFLILSFMLQFVVIILFELMSVFCFCFFFFLQSKRKSDPKKGRSQSSGEDVVWFFFIRAFYRLLFIHFFSIVYL